jgi:Uma2 family endonuclease
MALLEKERRAEVDGEPRLFTRDEYYKLGEAGILGEGDELIDGVVTVKGTAKPWRWTCDDYDRMAEVGILGRDERVALIDGEVISLAPIGPSHRSAMVDLVTRLILLRDVLGPDYYIMPESPVRLGNDLNPQPDIAVAYGRPEEYRKRHPGPSDLRLIVEISDSLLKGDRTRKYQLYAQLGIPEYWIVNLKEARLEVYRQPSGHGYAPPLIYTRSDHVSPLFAPQASIAVSDFIPSDLDEPDET